MLLSFALPCVMFAVFAIIFGSNANGPQPGKLKILVLDQDATRSSRRLVKSLSGMNQLEVTIFSDSTETSGANVEASQSDEGRRVGSGADRDDVESDSRQQAVMAVRSGKAIAAVIFPKGLEISLAQFGQTDRPAIELIYDPANPLAEQMLVGVLQASALTSSTDVLMEKGLQQFRSLGGPLSLRQETAIVVFRTMLGGANDDLASDGNPSTGVQQGTAAETPGNGLSGDSLSMANGIVRIESRSARDMVPDNRADDTRVTSAKMISYYAAGISVMFIMFSMSGAASSLLEHEERGTLERLLSGRMTIGHLLLSHWAFYVLLGVLQMMLMFVFAAIVFGLDLWHFDTLAGATVMAIVSSMASAAFIIMIATLCKSRKQLEGLSSIVILIMSAIGGSMMPRFIMPEFVLKLSSVAFNAWAMDGFLKVFWYNTPDQSVLLSISKEVTVILTMACFFLAVAFAAARKWAVS